MTKPLQCQFCGASGVMDGDCSTCDHSLAANCTQGNDGREFLHGDAPLPCPVWSVRGETWQRERAEWGQRNPRIQAMTPNAEVTRPGGFSPGPVSEANEG